MQSANYQGADQPAYPHSTFVIQNQNQNCFLVILLNEKHPPWPVIREISPYPSQEKKI